MSAALFAKPGEDGRLTVAVPVEGATWRSRRCGCYADAQGLSFEATERSLVVPCANAPVDLLLVRTDDIPRVRAGRRRSPGDHRCQPRRRDGGGRGADPGRPRLRAAACLAAAVPADAPQQADRGPRRPARRDRLPGLDGDACSASAASTAELVPVSGSVEATPRLGLADAIVDLVSTGSTMERERPASRSGRSSTHRRSSIGGRAAQSRRGAELVERLELMLSGRRRSPPPPLRDDERRTSTTSRRSAPSSRHGCALGSRSSRDEGEIAVHAAVDADDVWELLPVLRDAGATSILVLPIERLVS